MIECFQDISFGQHFGTRTERICHDTETDRTHADRRPAACLLCLLRGGRAGIARTVRRAADCFSGGRRRKRARDGRGASGLRRPRGSRPRRPRGADALLPRPGGLHRGRGGAERGDAQRRHVRGQPADGGGPELLLPLPRQRRHRDHGYRERLRRRGRRLGADLRHPVEGRSIGVPPHVRQSESLGGGIYRSGEALVVFRLHRGVCRGRHPHLPSGRGCRAQRVPPLHHAGDRLAELQAG